MAVAEVGAEVVVPATGTAAHENERGKIKTKPVEGTTIGREDMIRRWRELGRVLDRLLSLVRVQNVQVPQGRCK